MTVPPSLLVRRRDVQGLRALSVTAVVAFHAGLPLLPSGYLAVNVFFVISGYVVTGSLLREATAKGRVDYPLFLLRRVRRLLPAASAVVAATLVASVAVVPTAALRDIGVQGAASVLGVENVLLAAEGVGYLADSSTSPFLHFWSLGVEEQFYLLWPLALMALLALAHRRARLVPTVLLGLCALSFALAVTTTDRIQPWSFYLLPTRAWELGAGALVALTVGRRPEPPRAPRVVGWVAMAALVASLTLLDDQPHPSFATLVPVVSTSVLLAWPTSGQGSVGALLSHPLLTRVGDRSYPLYLWHWPALAVPVLALQRQLSILETGLALLVTALLGEASHQWLEPTHGASRVPRGTASRASRAAVPPVAAGAVLVLAAATSQVPVRPTATLPPGVPSWGAVGPPLDELPGSLPQVYADGCHLERRDTVPPPCRFGDVSGNALGDVVLFGDSHAAQWFSPLAEMARRSHVSLTSLTKGACPAADVALVDAALARSFTECDTWRDRALERIADEVPDLVVISGAGHLYDSAVEGPLLTAWRDGLRRTLARLPDETDVVVLGDTPGWDVDPVLCLSAPPWQDRSCTTSPSELARAVAGVERDVSRGAGATWVPTTGWLCDRLCEAVIGRTFAYSDSSHVSDAAARVLRPRLEAGLRAHWPGTPGS